MAQGSVSVKAIHADCVPWGGKLEKHSNNKIIDHSGLNIEFVLFCILCFYFIFGNRGVFD